MSDNMADVQAGRVRRPGPADAAMSGDQRALAQIWADVLGVTEIDLDDDFFALGGDSLLAVRAIVAAESHGISIELVDIFQTPTIRSLCPDGTNAPTAISPHRPADVDLLSAEDRRLLPADVQNGYPATLLQQGLIFETHVQDETLYHDIVSRQVHGRFDAAAMRAALNLLSARHEALRTSIDFDGFSVPMQLVHQHTEIPLTVTHGQDVEREFQDAGAPFDVATAPLIRARVLVTDDASFRLTYGFHHAIMDGWSETVFARELLTAYGALASGLPPGLPDRGTGIADFVQLERAVVENPEAAAFWRRRCAGLAGAGDDPAPPAARSTDRRTIRVTLPSDLSRDLEQLAAALRIPLKSLLLAGHLAAIEGPETTKAVTTGLVVNGRPEVEGSDGMIGLFLNVVPVGAPIVGSWAELAGAAHDSEVDLLPYRRYPYPAIKKIAGRSLFDSAFNYVRFHLRQDLNELPGIRVRPAEVRDKSSLPLLVELIHDPASTRITLALSADARRWTEPRLRWMFERHRDALGHMTVTEGHGEVSAYRAETGAP